MRYIKQTKTGEGGNCVQAVVASLFSLDFDKVPDFVNDCKSAETWFQEMNKWLRKHTEHYFFMMEYDKKWASKCLHGIWVAGVMGKQTGIHHVIIMEGMKMLHDPAGRKFNAYDIDEIWILASIFAPPDMGAR